MSKKIKNEESQVCRGVKDKQNNDVNKGCSKGCPEKSSTSPMSCLYFTVVS